MTTHLAFLLHMHQPLYVDPATGVALLPWVRLHGARAYLDVASLLDEYGDVRMTVNFVPSLIEQLEGVVGGARDAWLELAERPTGSWSPEERMFLVERFFSIAWNPNIESRPRYRELLEKRGRQWNAAELPARAASFTDGELRDLTVLFHLAWLGFAARRDRPEIAELERKGRGYDQTDLAAVVAVGRDAASRVLPLYRKLAERGQIELSSSPYYHPILPLLCDSDAAHRARPDLPLPDRYAFPNDGRHQISLGREAHERAFGKPPAGMWPPEGSISPEAVAAYRAEGIRWLASDEGNLFRSLGRGTGDDSGGGGRGMLYRPFRFQGVDLVFRDRDISDRIGFRYAQSDPKAAVDDLLMRVRRAGADSGARDALVPVILDGENPWETYPGSGEPFLRTLFFALSQKTSGSAPGEASEVRCTAVGPYLAAHPARTELSRLHSGSWIDSDFHIWIGDPVKNRAWNLLGRARRRWQQEIEQAKSGHGAATPGQIAAARRHLEAAEGSDWFWWFGEPFHSAEDALFDRLFRSHLAAAWRALGELPPDDLDEPVARSAAPPSQVRPRGLITPSIDGRLGSYFEWVGAGRYDLPRGAAMSEQPPVAAIHFGFDSTALYLRLDPAPAPGAAARLRGATVDLLLQCSDRALRLVAAPSDSSFAPSSAPATDLAPAPTDSAGAITSPPASTPASAPGEQLPSPSPSLGRIARGDLIELAVPFSAVAAEPGDRVELVLRLREDGVALCRIPRNGSLDVRVPDDYFDADHWML